MRSSKFMLVALLTCAASAALAQAVLQIQPLDRSDPCKGLISEGLASCGITAYGNNNYAAARKAWGGAAASGDYSAALWNGQMYESGEGSQIDFVLAFKWYDIAAALHARTIAKEPSTPDPILQDSNNTEIVYRDRVAQKLSAAQIKQAQQLSKQWQTFYLH